jgi:hypothetical protein
VPRFEPYTVIGIKRRSCSVLGCGNPGHANWNVCADNIGSRPQYRILCLEHDVALNEMAMRFVFGDTREADLAAYREKVLGNGPPADRQADQ